MQPESPCMSLFGRATDKESLDLLRPAHKIQANYMPLIEIVISKCYRKYSACLQSNLKDLLARKALAMEGSSANGEPGQSGFLGRGGQIRTADLTDPNRARYQTALRPEYDSRRGRRMGPSKRHVKVRPTIPARSPACFMTLLRDDAELRRAQVPIGKDRRSGCSRPAKLWVQVDPS